MNAPEEPDMLETWARLMRVPRDRAARVRTVIHRRWRQELWRARCRCFLLFAILVVAVAIMAAIALYWIGPGMFR